MPYYISYKMAAINTKATSAKVTAAKATAAKATSAKVTAANNEKKQFSDLSITLTNSMTKKQKQDFGFFITPHSIIEQLVSDIQQYAKQEHITIKTILEPSFGTGEIVNYCDQVFTPCAIDAVEYMVSIYDTVKETMKFKNPVTLINMDYREYNTDKMYDLTISNPPYVVFEKTKVPEKYKEFIVGRPNMFGLFILHQLSMTKSGGIAAFIIPKSFMNSCYYAKIRKYIIDTCTIIAIKDYTADNDFMETEQATFGLILRVTPLGGNPPHTLLKEELPSPILNKFCYMINTELPENDGSRVPGVGTPIFTPDATALQELFVGSTTLAQLGLSVKTGNITWNQYKEDLTPNQAETVLIYDTNITKDHTLKWTTFKNAEKQQYIKKEGRIEPILVVKRGHGNSQYKINYALVDLPNNRPYLVENHLNVIYSTATPTTPKKKAELLALYQAITVSFQNPKTQSFIDLFLGNNGLSKTELETIFPIYL